MLIYLLLLYLHSSSCVATTQQSLSNVKTQKTLHAPIENFAKRDDVDVKVNVDVHTNNKTEAIQYLIKQNETNQNVKPDLIPQKVKLNDTQQNENNTQSNDDKQNENQKNLSTVEANQDVTTNETQQNFKADEISQISRADEAQQNPIFDEIQQKLKPDEVNRNLTSDEPQDIFKADEIHQKENSDVMQQMLNKEEVQANIKTDSTLQNLKVGATQQDMSLDDIQPNLKPVEAQEKENLDSSNKIVKTDDMHLNETIHNFNEKSESFNETRESDATGESHQNYKHEETLDNLKLDSKHFKKPEQNENINKPENNSGSSINGNEKQKSKLKKKHHKSKQEKYRHNVRSNKDVLEKILKNPKSKEHVTAVKILKALVKKLKNKNKADSSNNINDQNISMTTHLHNTLKLAATKNRTIAESAANITKFSVSPIDQNPVVEKDEMKNELSSSKSVKDDNTKKKPKHKKKTHKKDMRKKNEKIRIILKKIKKAIHMTTKEKNNNSKIVKNDDKKIMNNYTLHGVYTNEINKTKEAFTEALKQAIKDTTTKTLLKLHQNLTETIHPSKVSPVQTDDTENAILEKNTQDQAVGAINTEKTPNNLHSASTFLISGVSNNDIQDTEEDSNQANETDTRKQDLNPHTAHTEDEESIHNITQLNLNQNTSDIKNPKDRLKAEGPIGRPLVNSSSAIDETNSVSEESGSFLPNTPNQYTVKEANKENSNLKEKQNSTFNDDEEGSETDPRKQDLNTHTAHTEDEESIHNITQLNLSQNSSEVKKPKDRLKAEGPIGRPLLNMSNDVDEANSVSKENGSFLPNFPNQDTIKENSNHIGKENSTFNDVEESSKTNFRNEGNAVHNSNALNVNKLKNKDELKSSSKLLGKYLPNALDKNESEKNEVKNSNFKDPDKSYLSGKSSNANTIKITAVANKNLRPLNHSTKIITNTYKIVIHKNDSRDFDTGRGDLLMKSKSPFLQSFTKNLTENNNESGSGTNEETNTPTEGADVEEAEHEIDFQNANVNRNKPSSMTGKTLTITFQENALALGGSSKEEKEPILPGTPHIKSTKKDNKHEVYEHTNQVPKYEDEETRKPFKIKEAPAVVQQKQYKIFQDNSKAEDANYTDALLHDTGTSKPQKLFNDSLFEMAGMKATNEQEEKQSNETQKDSIAKIKPTLKDFEDDTDDSAINGTLGNDEFDEEAIDNSGGASGSSNIGEELFFSKNERLSDDVLKGDDNFGKYMQDKRDIIAQSFKKFASNILNSHPRRFLFMNNTTNKISDRRTSFKRDLPQINNLKVEEPIFEKPVKKSFNTTIMKRNELALQKRDGTKLQNTTFFDNAVNSDMYASLFFKRHMKRNIVSEDDNDDDFDEQEQSSDRYHKEMILTNDHQLMHETPDKIFQKSSFSNKPYRKRNEIPIIERIIAKRSLIGKRLLGNKINKKQILHNKTSVYEKRLSPVKKSLDELNTIANKRIEIPLESVDDAEVTDNDFGVSEDSVDSLYKYGTDANIQSKPLFGSDNDPFTQKLLAHSKPIGLQKDTMSILDPPLIADSPSTPDPTPSSSFSKEDETEAKQVLMSYKNSILDDTAGQDERKLLESDSETNRVILDKEALQGIASDTAPMQPIDNPLMPVDTENSAPMIHQEGPPIQTSHGNMFSKMAQESVQAKEQSAMAQHQLEDVQTSLAEQKLHEMDMNRVGLEMKSRDQQNAIHANVRSSDSNSRNKSKTIDHLTDSLSLQTPHKKNFQNSKLKLKVESKHNESGMTKITSPSIKSETLKVAVIKPLTKTKSKGHNLSSLGSHGMSYEQIRKNFLKEQTKKEIQETELEISKRTRKSIQIEKRNDSENEDSASLGNEFEETLTNEADIPGVFAEKSDRKINREFIGDSIDTDTIIDDVRKRTPKIKNDVSIDEGLDTFKRHSVKKSVKVHRRNNKNKNSDLGKRDQETIASGPEYQQYALSKDSVQLMNKDGTINGVKIVDDETNENNDYNVQYSNKINVDENENDFQTSNEK